MGCFVGFFLAWRSGLGKEGNRGGGDFLRASVWRTPRPDLCIKWSNEAC